MKPGVLDWQRVLDPVLQVVGAPLPRAEDVDAHVLQVGKLHYLLDVVRALLEDDIAVGRTLLEGVFDLRSVISGPQRGHRTR